MGKTGCVHDDAYGRPPVDARVVDGAGEFAVPAGRVVWSAGAWSESVHEYVRHLEAVGFEGAPRVLAVRDGYGLASRRAILPASSDARLVSVEAVRRWALDAAGVAGALGFVAGELRWLHAILPSLELVL
jgi:hypothetical protein